MHLCSFKLNDLPISAFEITGHSFPAFSGQAPHLNKFSAMCMPDLGPIPVGTYYIINRQSGGRLGWLWDRLYRRDDWFALYANDGRIDDETFCNGILRGNFRLHHGGASRGCITIVEKSDFHVIKGLLLESGSAFIPRTDIRHYGRVIVQ
jgi:hypothetical protein